MTQRSLFIALILLPMGAGCMPQRIDPKATPATKIEDKKAYTEYWFNQPGIVHVDATNYDALWNACEAVALESNFAIERSDYRTGLLTTKPENSRQFFEFWRRDVVDFHSQVLSDAATRRRIVHFNISRLPGGAYRLEPKVVVEHFSMTERRITAVYQYQDAFSTRKELEEEQTDEGNPVRIAYWYGEGRDPALERALAERVRRHLQTIARK